MQRSTPGHASPQGGARSGVRAGTNPFVEAIGSAGDAFEREADRAAEAVVRGGLLRRRGSPWAAAAAPDDTIQRQCADCREEEEEQIRRAPKEAAPAVDAPVTQSPVDQPTPGRSQGPAESTSSSTNAAAAPAATALLVEDDAPAAPGQMRRHAFLSALRAEVCAAVDAALSGTGQSAKGCPYVEYWLGYYEDRSASQIQRALWRYAPEAATATDASEYVRIVTTRVLHSAGHWRRTGEITGVPEEALPDAMPGGKAAESFGGMFFKSRPGGARRDSVASVRDRLGPGQPMPGALRARMESAFATGFGGVRLHVDEVGGQLSNDLNARAFTVGEHVAFSPGEFRPGTVVGDALIAHELAHVLQQGRAEASHPMSHASDYGERRFEHDADASAGRAVGPFGDASAMHLYQRLRG
jgi:hypothetical protein